LRLLGAKVGKGVVIKPDVNIKYPWFLEIGDNVWIGEGAWIDNLAYVRIGNNVCISQEAYILTGNHNYKKDTFDLIVNPIVIEDGVWVGAKAIVCPGVTLKTHSVITVGSVITKSTEPYTIYLGITAEPIRKRAIE
jgi:putative colanic acid biosynthesis acetyltransferase WcaF